MPDGWSQPCGGTPKRGFRSSALRAFLRQEPGQAIEVEVWELPIAAFGSLIAGIPAPLAIRRVEIETGEEVVGFLSEAHATEGARDITSYGGWRGYLAAGGGP